MLLISKIYKNGISNIFAIDYIQFIINLRNIFDPVPVSDFILFNQI